MSKREEPKSPHDLEWWPQVEKQAEGIERLQTELDNTNGHMPLITKVREIERLQAELDNTKELLKVERQLNAEYIHENKLLKRIIERLNREIDDLEEDYDAFAE